MRAMVLAAGFGNRLRPLTDLLPKPLVPVANRPLIQYSFAQLRAASVTDVVVNLHHLGRMIEDRLHGDLTEDLIVHVSPEKQILGTGGGLMRARPWLKSETFFLLNGDVLSDVDLTAVLKTHRDMQAMATMVVRPMPASDSFTPLLVDEAGFICRFNEHRRTPRGATSECMFCGVHVLEPQVFEFLPSEGFACVNNQAYAAMLDAGLPVAAHWYEGPWFDLGTPERYLEANLQVLSGRVALKHLGVMGRQGQQDGVLSGQAVDVAPDALVGPDVALGDRCRVGSQARVARSVLWPDADVSPGDRIERSVVTTKHVVVI